MINTKRLNRLARKWQKLTALKGRRIPLPRTDAAENSLSLANKGHFVVYTADEIRFTVPLEYLSRNIFIELLKMSEEEFGLPSDGPITLPCDSIFLKYVMLVAKDHMPEDLEKAFVASLATCHFSASSSDCLGKSHQQNLIYGY